MANIEYVDFDPLVNKISTSVNANVKITIPTSINTDKVKYVKVIVDKGLVYSFGNNTKIETLITISDEFKAWSRPSVSDVFDGKSYFTINLTEELATNDLSFFIFLKSSDIVWNGYHYDKPLIVEHYNYSDEILRTDVLNGLSVDTDLLYDWMSTYYIKYSNEFTEYFDIRLVKLGFVKCMTYHLVYDANQMEINPGKGMTSEYTVRTDDKENGVFSFNFKPSGYGREYINMLSVLFKTLPEYNTEYKMINLMLDGTYFELTIFDDFKIRIEKNKRVICCHSRQKCIFL